MSVVYQNNTEEIGKFYIFQWNGMDKLHKVSYVRPMKWFLIAFLLFTGVCAAEESETNFPEALYYEEPYEVEKAPRADLKRESGTCQETVFEDPDCDSCFIEANHLLPFPLPPLHFPPPPPHWFPPHPHSFCGHGASEVCQTINGNMCYSFILNYPFMTNWITSCIEVWPIFRYCSQLSVPVPIFSGCYLIGTPCLCGFPGYYEAGHIL